MDPRYIDAHEYRNELNKIKAVNQACGAHPRVNLGLNQALGALTLAPTAKIGPEWISVKDRLPEDAGEHIVMIKGALYPTTLCFSPEEESCWYSEPNGEVYAVTHWMPMPEPPAAVTVITKGGEG